MTSLRNLMMAVAVATVIPAAVVERHVPPAEAAPSARPLPFFYDLYTFRGARDSTTVIASFAVPVGKLERQSGEDWGVRYGFDVTLVLSDTALNRVSRTDDSVFVQVPSALDGDHLLHTHIEVAAPPSGTTWQRVIMTDATAPGIGTLYHTPYPVPDYSGTDLMLSDIALGLPEATEGWTRGDVTLALLPTSQFPESAFDVYYEVYNLSPHVRYATEVSIEPIGVDAGRADADRRVRTSFISESGAMEGGLLAELRRVETALPEGRYRLTVTVTDGGTGQSAERSRTFHVRGWSDGATLVRAHPSRVTPIRD